MEEGFEFIAPDDIRVRSVEIVDPEFHARFDVKAKEYRYRLWMSEEPCVFKRQYTHHYPYPLNLNAMKEAAALLVGTHDFTSFVRQRQKCRIRFEPFT